MVVKGSVGIDRRSPRKGACVWEVKVTVEESRWFCIRPDGVELVGTG